MSYLLLVAPDVTIQLPILLPHPSSSSYTLNLSVCQPQFLSPDLFLRCSFVAFFLCGRSTVVLVSKKVFSLYLSGHGVDSLWCFCALCSDSKQKFCVWFKRLSDGDWTCCCCHLASGRLVLYSALFSVTTATVDTTTDTERYNVLTKLLYRPLEVRPHFLFTYIQITPYSFNLINLENQYRNTFLRTSLTMLFAS